MKTKKLSIVAGVKEVFPDFFYWKIETLGSIFRHEIRICEAAAVHCYNRKVY